MSDQPEQHDDFYPNGKSGFHIVFDDFVARTRARFDARIASAEEYAVHRNGPNAARWKMLTDEAYSIKLANCTPGERYTPEAMQDRKAQLEKDLLAHGFAVDEDAAHKLYKDLGRYAHGALESLHDTPEEKLLQRPYHCEIGADGRERFRGARGRFKSVKPRMEQDLDDALGDMKRDWVARLGDAGHEAQLRKIFNGHMRDWANHCVPYQEIKVTAEDARFSVQELMASGDEMLSARHALPRIYDWPTRNGARHVDVGTYVDQMELKEPLVKMLVLRRLEAELRPLVWELGEEYARKQRNGPAGYTWDVLEIEDRLYAEVDDSMHRLLTVAKAEIDDEEEYGLLEGDMESLIDAATASIDDYALVSAKPGQSAAR